jgi:hypothetical protein
MQASKAILFMADPFRVSRLPGIEAGAKMQDTPRHPRVSQPATHGGSRQASASPQWISEYGSVRTD